MTTAPSVLIAEDEAVLGEQLREMLAELWPEARICALAADGAQALAALETHRPDVAFLDIRMPHVSGLEVAQQIAGRCHVVFVTAYDRFAIDAFERGAVDYLLKPLSRARLAQTVARLKERLGSSPARISELIGELAAFNRRQQDTRYLEWIKASQGSTVRLIAAEDVCFFQADERYTRVATAEGESFIKTPIRELAEQLDPRHFWQVHRSTLVNVRGIAAVTRSLSGSIELKLKHRADRLAVSRAFAHLFRQM